MTDIGSTAPRFVGRRRIWNEKAESLWLVQYNGRHGQTNVPLKQPAGLWWICETGKAHREHQVLVGRISNSFSYSFFCSPKTNYVTVRPLQKGLSAKLLKEKKKPKAAIRWQHHDTDYSGECCTRALCLMMGDVIKSQRSVVATFVFVGLCGLQSVLGTQPEQQAFVFHNTTDRR